MWIVKWFAPLPADGRVYFKSYKNETATWVRSQKQAKRFATKADAYAVSSMWSPSAARPVRLVPRKKP